MVYHQEAGMQYGFVFTGREEFRARYRRLEGGS